MRFGILGEAKIAREWLVPAIIKSGHEVTHLGRRNPSQESLPEIYQDVIETDYESLLAEPSIDAIYNPLPNHLHVPYSIAALHSGKHVLCEKPVALNIKELKRLEKVATKSSSYFQEAFMVQYHPQWKWLQELNIGQIQSAHFIFSYPQQPTENYRNRAEDGGGPLYDIGCYAILSGCLLFGGMPEVISANAIMSIDFDVEKQVDAVLRWPNGAILNFTVSGSAALCQSLSVLGTNGWAKLNVPINPPEVTHAYWSNGGLQEGTKVSFPACNQYILMVDDFVSQANSGMASDFSISRVVTKTINEIQRIAGLNK